MAAGGVPSNEAGVGLWLECVKAADRKRRKSGGDGAEFLTGVGVERKIADWSAPVTVTAPVTGSAFASVALSGTALALAGVGVTIERLVRAVPGILQPSRIQCLLYGDTAMTILDDLFKEAEGLWNSIQGTAENTQLVVVNGAMASLSASSLTEGIAFQPRILPIDRLIYNPAAGPPFTPAKFAGSELTITAPNFHTHTFQRDYGILWGAPHPRQQPTTSLASSTSMLRAGDGAAPYLSQSPCTISD
jgi:hypothetical protein